MEGPKWIVILLGLGWAGLGWDGLTGFVRIVALIEIARSVREDRCSTWWNENLETKIDARMMGKNRFIRWSIN